MIAAEVQHLQALWRLFAITVGRLYLPFATRRPARQTCTSHVEIHYGSYALSNPKDCELADEHLAQIMIWRLPRILFPLCRQMVSLDPPIAILLLLISDITLSQALLHTCLPIRGPSLGADVLASGKK